MGAFVVVFQSQFLTDHVGNCQDFTKKTKGMIKLSISKPPSFSISMLLSSKSRKIEISVRPGYHTFFVIDFANDVQKDFDYDLTDIGVGEDTLEKGDIRVPCHTVDAIVLHKNLERVETGKTLVHDDHLGILGKGLVDQATFKEFFDGN